MTPQGVAAVAVLGALVWIGLALCLAIAIGLSIREADRRRPRPAEPVEQPTTVPAHAHQELYREWLRDGDPSAIRPPSVPPRWDLFL